MRVFFGHQSVGYGIVQGLHELHGQLKIVAKGLTQFLFNLR